MRHIWLSERTGVLGGLIKTLMNLLIKKYFYFRLACSKHILWMQIARSHDSETFRCPNKCTFQTFDTLVTVKVATEEIRYLIMNRILNSFLY